MLELRFPEEMPYVDPLATGNFSKYQPSKRKAKPGYKIRGKHGKGK